MKDLKYSFTAKVLCVFLSVIIFAVTVCLSGAFVAVAVLGGLSGNNEALNQAIANRYLSNQSVKLYNYVYENETLALDNYLSAKNYYATVYDENGAILYNNYRGELSIANYSTEYEYFTYDEEKGDKEYKFSVELFAKADPTQQDFYSFVLDASDYVYTNKWTFLVFSLINVIVLSALTVYLCRVAGKRSEDDTPTRTFFDKIPYDLLLITFAVILFFEFLLIDGTFYSPTLQVVLLFISFFVDFPILLFLILSTARRIKTGVCFKKTVCGYTAYKIYGIFYKMAKRVKYIFKSISLVKKTAICSVTIMIFNLFLFWICDYSNSGTILFLLLSEFVCLTLFAIYIAVSLKNLQKAGEEISNGNFEQRVNLRHLKGELLSFGKTLNNIGKGLETAVSDQIKSERLKTELITNVSHDIKTPLTSIINYVDLINKENTENENIKNYISVLDKQSGRLKKLIEDLIEASKASTGNISINLEPCELGVLLAQTAGEYEERARQNGLDIVLEKDDRPVVIMADGRHLWRVFDNLMNNICKYSQNGTRVYLSLKRYNNKAVVTFRNISKTSLNISSDELTGRFVRGDSSRNTEGSGLGLSIAKSLVELQNGKMILNIDGDLFKVLLTFDIV